MEYQYRYVYPSEAFSVLFGFGNWWSSNVPGFRPSVPVLEGVLREYLQRGHDWIPWSELVRRCVDVDSPVAVARTLDWFGNNCGVEFGKSGGSDKSEYAVRLDASVASRIVGEIDRQRVEREVPVAPAVSAFIMPTPPGPNSRFTIAQFDTLPEGVPQVEVQQVEAPRVEAPRVEEKEKKGMSIEERVTGSAVQTGSGVVAAMKEGLAISGSQQISDGIVRVFHEHLGSHVPVMDSPLGKQVERLAIPALLHFLVGIAADKVPGAELIQKTCLRAITGVAKDDGDAVIKALRPMFDDLARMAATDGMELAAMASGLIKSVPAPTVDSLIEPSVKPALAAAEEVLQEAAPVKVRRRAS